MSYACTTLVTTHPRGGPRLDTAIGITLLKDDVLYTRPSMVDVSIERFENKRAWLCLYARYNGLFQRNQWNRIDDDFPSDGYIQNKNAWKGSTIKKRIRQMECDWLELGTEALTMLDHIITLSKSAKDCYGPDQYLVEWVMCLRLPVIKRINKAFETNTSYIHADRLRSLSYGELVTILSAFHKQIDFFDDRDVFSHDPTWQEPEPEAQRSKEPAPIIQFPGTMNPIEKSMEIDPVIERENKPLPPEPEPIQNAELKKRFVVPKFARIAMVAVLFAGLCVATTMKLMTYEDIKAARVEEKPDILATAQVEAEPKALLAKAFEQIKAGDITSSIRTIQLAQSHPDLTEFQQAIAHQYLGKANRYQENYLDAIDYLKIAMRKFQKIPGANHAQMITGAEIARIFLLLEDHESARNWLDYSWDESVTNLGAQMTWLSTLTRLQTFQNDYKNALKTCEERFDLNPNDHNAVSWVGLTHALNGNLEEAILYTDQASTMRSDHHYEMNFYYGLLNRIAIARLIGNDPTPIAEKINAYLLNHKNKDLENLLKIVLLFEIP